MVIERKRFLQEKPDVRACPIAPPLALATRTRTCARVLGFTSHCRDLNIKYNHAEVTMPSRIVRTVVRIILLVVRLYGAARRPATVIETYVRKVALALVHNRAPYSSIFYGPVTTTS